MNRRPPVQTNIRRTLCFEVRRLILSAWLLAAGALPASGQIDTALVQAVVEIDIDGGPSQVVPAVSYNSTMLVPLRTFLEMAELQLAEFTPDSTLTVLIQPGDVTLQFRPDSGYFVRGDSLFALEPLEAVWWDGDLYVATEVLDRAFGIATSMDWASLSVLVGQASGLPVLRRARRERRHAALDRPGPPPLPPFSTRPPERFADGAVFEWSITSPTDGTTDDLTLVTGLGASLYGGSVELRHQLRNSTGPNSSDMRLSWTRAWPQRRWFKQLGIGDVRTSGMRARTIRGFVVTNAPFIRASEFEVEEVFGRLPAGWEVELYESGRLRGYDEVDALGVYRLPIHLKYGQNPYELVLYGPTGEVIRERRTIRVPFSRIPAGQLEYAVAAGSCRYEPCSGMVSTDLRYGLTNWATVQAGTDYFALHSAEDLWQPYAAVSVAPLQFLRVTGEAIYDGQLRASLGIEPRTSFRFDLSHTVYDETGHLFRAGAFERRRTEGSLFWQPQGNRSKYFLQFVGYHSTGPDLKRNFQRVSATARLGRVRHSIGLRHDFTQQGLVYSDHRTGIDWNADFVFTGGHKWLRTASVRTGISVDAGDGLSRLRAAVGRQIKRRARIDIGLGWLRNGGVSLDVGFNTAISGPRFGTRNHFDNNGGTDGVMFMDGSVVVDPDTRTFRLSDGRDLGRAGISGVVFLDENDNGVQDVGERGLEGVPILVGGWHEETDATGHFATWDLLPYEDSFVQVDQIDFDDPRLVPLNTVISVSATPNSFQAVPVPIVIGAEISGYVVLDGEGIPGIAVELRNLTIGRTISVVTFSDGGFYSVSIPPGEYDITVPEEVLERLGAAATAIQINIPSGQGDKRIEELIVNLERVSDEPGILDRYDRNHRRQQRERSKGNN